MIRQGQVVTFKPAFRDPGDEGITFRATDNEEKGRVTVEAQIGLPINPRQVVLVEWLAHE